MTTAPRSPLPADTLPGPRLVPAPAAPSSENAAPALPAPRALLLDFGGVVISTAARVSWARELAEIVVDRARPLGAQLDLAAVEESLRAGRTALSLWKNAASRRLAPRELSPREIVEDFLLADLQATVRSALSLDAQELLAAMAPLVAEHHLRPGIAELLPSAPHGASAWASSPTPLRPRAPHDPRRLGLGDAFGVQIYPTRWASANRTRA